MEQLWNILLLLCCSEGFYFARGGHWARPPLELDSKEEKVTSVAGSTAVLPCSVKNLGTRTVLWLYNETILTSFEFVFPDDPRVSPRVSVEYRRYTNTSYADFNLHIQDVTASDSGQYKCKISSKSGLMFKTVNLEVKGNNPKDKVTVEEGEMVLLPCNIENATKDTVLWKRNDLDVSLGEIYGSFDTRITVRKNGNLLIESVESRHQGIYTCHMPEHYLVSESVSLRVTAGTADKQARRMFISGTRHVTVHNDIHLVCLIKGISDLSSTVNWFRDNLLIRSTPRIATMLETLMRRDKYISELIIHNAGFSDSGYYKCRALPHGIEIEVLVSYQPMTRPQPETETTTWSVPVTTWSVPVTTWSVPVTTESVPVTTMAKSVNCTNDNAKEKTTDAPTGKEIRNKLLKETRLEYYRERILTDRKRRNIMDLQESYYRTMLKYFQKQDLATNETEMLTILAP